VSTESGAGGKHARREVLAEWVRHEVGRPDATLRQIPGGGRHQAWSVSDDDGGRWFLRTDAHEPDARETYTLRREADAYRIAAATGIPTPRVIAVHPDLEAVLLEHVDGGAAFASLDTDSQTSVISDFAGILARMHGFDPTTVDCGLLGPATDVAHLTRAELDTWQRRLEGIPEPDPFLVGCFMWLRDNMPETGHVRPTFVQGDTGPGNFLHDGHRVTAVLDFELAHLGDPMTDIAWVGTRNAQEPVPDFDAFVRAYETSSGTSIDPHRVRYHMLFAEVRIAVLSAERMAFDDDTLAEHGNGIIYGALHRRLAVEALAAAMGVTLPIVETRELVDTGRTRYFEGLLAQLQAIVLPAVDDALARRRVKSLARSTKYLRDVDRSLAWPDLGPAPSAHDIHELILWAAERSARETAVCASAMGALASRHLPPV